MTNGQKLKEVFPKSRTNEEDFLWSVGLEVGETTIIFSKAFWNAEYEGEDDQTAYWKGWSDALDSIMEEDE